MKKKILRLFLFLAMVFPSVYAQFPQAYEQIITHNASSEFLKRLYNIRWIESFDVRPCIEQGIMAWHKAYLEQDHDAKNAALIAMRSELIKALGLAKNYPSWITFHTLEHLELEHVTFGYSKHELKKAAKILSAFCVGALVMYLLKQRSEAIWKDNVDYVEAKLINLGNTFDAKIDAKGEKLEAKIDAKSKVVIDQISTLIKTHVLTLEDADTKVQKWRQEIKNDLIDVRATLKADAKEATKDLTTNNNYTWSLAKSSAALMGGGALALYAVNGAINKAFGS